MKTVDAKVEPVTWQPALVELYEQRFADLARIAYLMIGRLDVADEVVQEAFVAANRSWDGVRAPLPYVRTAVVNRSRSWHRRVAVERRHLGAPAPAAVNHPDEMWDVLQTLPERERAAVVLRFYEDLSYAEIGAMLECPEPTARTIVHRSLLRLRKEIAQ